jgi:CheY-like chemotaxis protein
MAAGKETVLVAEDDTEVRIITKKLLEDSGYNVIDAVDGEDAIRKFKQMRDEIDLLILDVIMPRKNGREVYNETSKIAPEIKALFLSGYNEDIIFKKGMLDPGLNFLSKPVLPAELLRKVRDVLEQ